MIYDKKQGMDFDKQIKILGFLLKSCNIWTIGAIGSRLKFVF
jgi:hypothetical protein